MSTRGTSESEDEIGVKDKKAILSDGGVFETEDDKLRLKSLPENAFILCIETSCDDTAALHIVVVGIGNVPKYVEW